MKYEIAALASKLKLSAKELANPKVQILLAEFLEDEAKMLLEPPLELPRKPGAVNGWSYAAHIQSMKKDR